MESNKNYGKNRRGESFAGREQRGTRSNSNLSRERKSSSQFKSDSTENKREARKSFFTEKFGFLAKSRKERRIRKFGEPTESTEMSAENKEYSSYRNNRKDYGDNSYRKPYHRNERDDKRRRYDREDRADNGYRREYADRNDRNERRSRYNDREQGERSYDEERRGRSYGERRPRYDKNMGKTPAQKSEILEEIINHRHREGRYSERKPKVLSLAWNEERGPIRLNKYISNSGICSRREADNLIIAGAIKVNGVVVSELGTKVMPTDEVRYEDKILQREKPVYLLLNKPKDFITTTEDERDRNSVMSLVEGVCPERIYPVGRLDRNTTGLLLFTNDGEMTKKLTHPKFEIKKIYQVELDKNMTLSDFETLANGIELYDGFIKPDELEFVGEQRNVLGITLHSGKNRIVRRMFGHLGYEVEKLDRVYYAGLTKKDLPRGQYRFLTQAEINMLKMSL